MNLTSEAKVLTGIGIATVLILTVGVFLLSKSSSPQSTQPTVVTDTTTLYGEMAHVKGPSEAKVKLVEFSDFQCPACRAANPLVKQIFEQNKDNLAVVYRHFPLPQHTNAINAAKAAESAGEQGKFWEMGELLFDNQDLWSQGNPEEKFISYAQQLGLDVEKFKSDYRSNKYDSRIQKDYADGASLGVNSTPSFYFNGVKFKENLSPQIFQSKIDQLLK